VAEPESEYCCDGCFISFDEKIAIAGKDKPQKTRSYSWLLTEGLQLPLTKADKKRILAILLDPPKEPWAMALAESGQKQLLYRTPVSVGGAPWQVRLENELVTYSPKSLMDRYGLALRVVAGVGHRGAAEPNVNSAFALGVELLESWQAVLGEPLTSLALFVCPSKEECAACLER
jgi:hypothetical protein